MPAQQKRSLHILNLGRTMAQPLWLLQCTLILAVPTTFDAAVQYNAIEKCYSKNSEKLHWLKCWGEQCALNRWEHPLFLVPKKGVSSGLDGVPMLQPTCFQCRQYTMLHATQVAEKKQVSPYIQQLGYSCFVLFFFFVHLWKYKIHNTTCSEK